MIKNVNRVCNDFNLELLVNQAFEASSKVSQRILQLIPNDGDELLVEKEYLSNSNIFFDDEGERYVFAGIKNVYQGFFNVLGYKLDEYKTMDEPPLCTVSSRDDVVLFLYRYFEDKNKPQD